MAKIRGTFCREVVAPKRGFDPRSFRWIKRGANWVLIGCPRGKWTARTERCRVGTRAHEVLKATPGSSRCPRGSRRVRK